MKGITVTPKPRKALPTTDTLEAVRYGTVAQRLVWTGQQLAHQSPLYNIAFRVDFSTAVDPIRFQNAFDQFVEQSDTMRMVMSSETGAFSQRILDNIEGRCELVDVSSSSDPENEADRWIAERVKVNLNLDRSNFDCALICLGPDRWTWFFNQHHLATDGWSTVLVYRAMGEAYAAEGDRRLHPLPTLPPYVDHIAFENRHMESKVLAEAKKHWQKRVDRAGSPVRLYGCKATADNAESVSLPIDLGEVRTRRLNRLAETDGVRLFNLDLTRYSLFASAFAAFLSRVSGQSNLRFGSPAHNRLTPAARETMGLFVEVFPLVCHLEEDETFRTLLSKVVEESLNFVRHSQPGASTSTTAQSFNTVLNYVHVQYGRFGDLPARVSWVHPGASDPGHVLRVHIHDINDTGHLTAIFEINSTLFHPLIAKSMPQHFLRILDAMLDDIDTVINSVPLAQADEINSLPSGFHHFSDQQQIPTVVSLIDRCADSKPGAIALRIGARSVSYRELKSRSIARAEELFQHGVRPGDHVGIHVKRSDDMVIWILAVLRAGAAYVPIDYRTPEVRRNFILDDTRARLTITENGLQIRPFTDSEVDTIQPNDHPNEPQGTGDRTDSDETAYVLYTSGTTGRPKGVVVDHRGLAAYVNWARRAFGGDGPISMPLFTAIGFDLTVTSLFVPLISGGSIVIYPEPEEGPDLSVLQVFEDDSVDVVKLTPSHLGLLVNQAQKPDRIHSLIVGGEDLKSTLALAAHKVLAERVTIFNEYGPTEAIVGCTHHRFDPVADATGSVPIGVPADGTAVYVLDKGLNIAPQGVVGEIYIGGNRIARGYWNSEGLTSERFLADPWLKGQRMYRSGDRGRVNVHGQLEFLGRADDQVKIRGVRVEVAEVELALASHQAVTSCVVVPFQPKGPAPATDNRRCTRCGLSSSYPGTTFNHEGVCNICRGFEGYRKEANGYFKNIEDLRELLDVAASRRTGRFDCMILVSGGKDSTYALYQLARETPRILALTLDNGYISDGAKSNIRRAVADLGVEHRYVTTPAMNSIFIDSLKRHSNVCNGCFKALYTLAVNVALHEGIPAIVTGLSRGQFFETRLTPELFLTGPVDVEAIDRTVLEARKSYHRVDDAVSRSLDVSALQQDETFEKVQFIDFYRYCDVNLDEVYAFLDEHAPWTRPTDTGRSTNCRLNDVGIFVHSRREGFHNYALPYSWDVRMGHKKKDAAVAELEDEIDARNVAVLLDEIGYDEDVFDGTDGIRLVAYVTADRTLTSGELREFLQGQLIEPMIPGYFIQLDELPLTKNGKVDKAALPSPSSQRSTVPSFERPPTTDTEILLSNLWKDVLRLPYLSADDNFYDVGGDSISAIQIAVRALDQGIAVEPLDIFKQLTIAALAAAVDAGSTGASTAQPETPESQVSAAPFELANLRSGDLEKIAGLLEPTDGD